MSETDPLFASKKDVSGSYRSFLVDNQNFLKTEAVESFSKEWFSLYDIEKMELKTCLKHPFTIKLTLKYAHFIDPKDDLNIARVFLGIKNQQTEYKKSIEMGLYMGRLYICDIFDFVNIDKQKLVEGIQLVLIVCPSLNGKSATLLRAIDLSGNILSEIKTSKFLSADWNGGISVGAHFKSLLIEGVQSIY